MATSAAPKRKMAATSLANLRPFSVQTKNKARSAGARGGVKSGESRRKKKLQRDLLRDILNTKLKDLPIGKERLSQLCSEMALLPDSLLSVAHCVTIVTCALRGDHFYSRLLWEADGSLDPLTQEYIPPKNIYITLSPSREQYARKAVERVMERFTAEEREDLRIFFDSIEEARESQKKFEEAEKNGYPDL